METFAGLGYTAGPVIGGVLYEYGGFQLPFFVLGALLVLATLVSFFLIEEFDEEDEDQSDGKGMLGMLKIPVIWIMVFAVIICAISLSFFDPTLADHLSSFKLSTTLVGLMFLLCGGIYTATAPLWGILIDKWHCTNALMVFGSTATIFSMLLIGPSPIFNFEKNLVLIGISLAILGVAAGALYIPTFQNCLDAVKEYGYDDSFQTYGCVSGVFQSAFACGAFIGPTLGAFGVQKIGFGWTTTIIAFINVIFVLVLTICWIARSKIFKGPASKDHEPVPQA
jgi:MFS family permease